MISKPRAVSVRLLSHLIVINVCEGLGNLPWAVLLAVLCQRALRMNAGSSELWWHYLRLELCYIDKLRQRQKLLGIDEVSETTGEPSKLSAATVRIASTIVTNARAATTPSAHLLLGLAEVCLDFPGTEEVENTLLRCGATIGERHSSV